MRSVQRQQKTSLSSRLASSRSQIARRWATLSDLRLAIDHVASHRPRLWIEFLELRHEDEVAPVFLHPLQRRADRAHHVLPVFDHRLFLVASLDVLEVIDKATTLLDLLIDAGLLRRHQCVAPLRISVSSAQSRSNSSSVLSRSIPRIRARHLALSGSTKLSICFCLSVTPRAPLAA